MCYTYYKWIIYLSGKVSYRLREIHLIKKIDDSHNVIIPFLSTREESSSIMVNEGEGFLVSKVEFDQGLSK